MGQLLSLPQRVIMRLMRLYKESLAWAQDLLLNAHRVVPTFWSHRRVYAYTHIYTRTHTRTLSPCGHTLCLAQSLLQSYHSLAV